MERLIDSKIEELKRHILVMSGNVESALSEVTTALTKRDVSRFKKVHELEQKINEEHVSVDNLCVQILAQESPMAKDLRLIMSIVKINTDLERMGDQATNIAYTANDYLGRTPLKHISTIVEMSTLVRDMVHLSLDSFVRGDVDLAREILLKDDEVDDRKNSVFHELSQHMKSFPDDVEASLDVILMARNFERLGDHATNIAEDVIYAVTGKDVRHGGIYDK